MVLRAATVLVLGALAVVATAALGGDATALVALSIVTLVGSAIAWITSAGESAPAAPEVSDAIAELDVRIAEAARGRGEMRMRAETAGRFREEFVAAVRHELKTPLNAILGFTEVLLEGIDGPLSEQQREDVTAIRQAGLYLSKLVEAVLEEWAGREAEPGLVPVELEQMMREVARLLEGQAVAKDVVVKVEIARDLPVLLGDPRRLRQVLINLGTNAVRATARGSVTLAAHRDPDGVRVSVRDTGYGIPPEEIAGLFDAFAQAGTEQQREGGSGLGLALTRDMVEWHGGYVEVESALDEGTVFHVVLPLERD